MNIEMIKTFKQEFDHFIKHGKDSIIACELVTSTVLSVRGHWFESSIVQKSIEILEKYRENQFSVSAKLIIDTI